MKNSNNLSKPNEFQATVIKVAPGKNISAKTIIVDLIIFGVFLIVIYLFLPVQLGGTKTYVITAGTSMLPDFERGDLIITKE